MSSLVVRRLAPLLMLSFAMGSFAGDGDWPTMRGPSLDGSAHAHTALALGKAGNGLAPVWSKEVGSAYSSISVEGKRAVTMGSDGKREFTICLDASSGAELWRYDMDVCYVGHDGSHDGPNSTPVIAGNQVFGISALGNLFALELSSGKLLWKRHMVEDLKAAIPPHGFTTVPLVVGESLVVLTGETSAVMGLNKNSGATLWSLDKDTIDYQSPVAIQFGGRNLIVGNGRQKLRAIDASNGKLIWEHALANRDGGLNPLFIAPNKLLLGGNGANALMFELSGEGDQITAKELWRSREISRSFNVPVYHKGFIYGYANQFMTCVNAQTGELAWKSREPGDGFLILVDDYLVVQTKRGSLHVARAVETGYEEVASVPAFDSLSWTPPSFANDMIFTRNLATVTAFKVDKVDKVIAVKNDMPRYKIANSKFESFAKELAASSDKPGMVAKFMATHKTFPVIEGNNAHYVYVGPVKDLTLVGDMLDTDGSAQMNHVDGTDLYYASFEFPLDARISYRYIVNFDSPTVDPHNPYKVNGIQGEYSELRMPGFSHAADLEEPTGKRGTVDSFELKSSNTGNTKSVAVYLPPDYAMSDARHPVVYVNYGKGAREFGLMTHTLDNLIGKTIKPVIAVFVESQDSFNEYARDKRDAYQAFITGELVANIDGKYRTVASPASRLYMGADEGGFAALYAALKEPEVFGMAAGQSTHLLKGAGNQEMFDLVAGPKKNVSIFLGWGRYDYRSASGGYNWAELNGELVRALKAKGYSLSSREYASGWDWSGWRQYTHTILEHFFKL